MKTQAWGWLAAAVVAAGLNAGYHDGAFEWAHRAAERVEHGSAAVLALASGRADQFLVEARMLTGREGESRPWSGPLARIQTAVATRVARTDHTFAGFEAMSARHEAQLARLEASREMIEARIAARTARMRVRIPDASLNPVSFHYEGSSVCPRVRAHVRQLPRVRVQTPSVDVELPSASPM